MDPNQPPVKPPQPNNIDSFSLPPQPAGPIAPESPSAPVNLDQVSIAPEPAPQAAPTTPSLPTVNTNPVAASTPMAPTTDINQIADQTAQPTVEAAGSTITPQVSVFQSDETSQPAGEPSGPFQKSNKPKKRWLSKKILLTLVLPLLILVGGGVAAAYFGYILPNKPENIWNKSLVNMGTGYDRLVSYSADLQKSFKGVTVKGSYKATGPFEGEGTIDSNSYENDSTSKIGLKLTKGSLDIESRSLSAKNSKFADLYFKISGIKDLLGGTATPYDAVIKSLDGQWISIDHSLLDQAASSAGGTSQAKVSAQDITEFQQAIGAVSKDWLFTDNANHQVLKIKQKVGKEKQDNRPVYHFKTDIDKANLKSYTKALRDKLKDTKLAKDYFSTIGSVKDNEIDKSIDEMSQPPSFDVWMDTHTKLIHAIRIGDDKEYTQFSQDYQSGDSLPFGLKAYSKQGSDTSILNLSANLDMKSNKLDMNFDFEAGGEKVTGSLAITQNKNTVKVDRPTGAKSIQDILIQIFGTDFGLSGSGGSATLPKDFERQTDIKAIQVNLEAYYAKNGFYPTFASLNDTNWATKYLKSLNKEALKDPDGKGYNLAASPAANIYSYSVTSFSGKACTNTGGNNCLKFTLTATLSTGKKYTVTSLN